VGDYRSNLKSKSLTRCLDLKSPSSRACNAVHNAYKCPPPNLRAVERACRKFCGGRYTWGKLPGSNGKACTRIPRCVWCISVQRQTQAKGHSRCSRVITAPLFPRTTISPICHERPTPNIYHTCLNINTSSYRANLWSFKPARFSD